MSNTKNITSAEAFAGLATFFRWLIKLPLRVAKAWHKAAKDAWKKDVDNQW